MTAFPNYDPFYSAQRNDVPASTNIKFGDGYEQRLSFGFALRPQEWDLTFIDVDSIIDEIDTFLAARRLESDSFEWTPPDSTLESKWICKSWSKEKFDYKTSRLTARFTQKSIPDIIPDTWVLQYTAVVADEAWDSGSVIADETGSFYMLKRFSLSPVNGWFKIAKFSASGVIQWVKNINKIAGVGTSSGYSGQPTFCVTPQSVIIGSFGNEGNLSRIICLDAVTGSLKWAKSLTITRSSGYDSYQIQSIYSNSVTGHIYVCYGYNKYFASEYTLGFITISDTGTLVNCLDLGTDGSNGYSNNFTGIYTKSDGSILIAARIQSGYRSFARQGILVSANSVGSAISGSYKRFGNSTYEMQFNQGCLLSNGVFIVNALYSTNSATAIYAIDPSTGQIQESKNYAITIGTVHQIKERVDGTIAVAAYRFGGNSAQNNQWTTGNTPSYVSNSVSIYSSNLSSLTQFRESGIELSPFTNTNFGYVQGISSTKDRYIGAPIVSNDKWAITSMNLNPVYYRYSCIQNYQSSGTNSYAKFASATSTLPLSTSAAPTPAVTTPTYTTSSRTVTLTDYASSITLADGLLGLTYFSGSAS